LIYNLSGQSQSKTAQIEFDWDVHRRLDLRLAYRFVNAYTDRILAASRRDPLVSKHRGFAQLSYASKPESDGGQWRADVTAQWVGSQRLPSTAMNAPDFSLPDEAPSFTQLNLQFSRDWNANRSVYIGVENATNVRQDRPILGAGAEVSETEFNDYFDASFVYGPIFGRMAYAGLRWRISGD